MTLLETAAAIRARKVSSTELTTESLRRISQTNPKLNAFITVCEEHALARAAAMDAEIANGFHRGPLHGVPVAHKDLVCTKGIRTTAGSRIFADYIPGHDADIVTRLNEAGAVMVGKTGLHELAYGITSNNPHFGPVRNPWDPNGFPADRAAVQALRSRRIWYRWRPAPIPAGPSGFQRLTAASSG